MAVKIGSRNTANETALKGSVRVTQSQAREHPEWLSDVGNISWDLTVQKLLTFASGPAGSVQLIKCAPAKMGWHVQGMRAKYNGTVTFNGVVYHVDPETSYGYQDKNFGSDFTNPWYWISCNSFKGSENTSLVLGGGQPVLFGEPQGKKALIGFSHKGQMLYKWNFADIPAGQGADYVKQSIDVRQIGAGASANITWNISSEDPTNKVVINMTCPRSLMLRLRYENSAGFFNHKKLWNGAHVSGTVQLFTKGTVGANNAAWSLVDNLVCEGGAGEYGKF